MRWVILILLLVAIFKAFTGMNTRKSYDNGDRKVSLFLMIEHFAGMLIAIILITIGKGVGKKNIPDKAKHKRAFWFFVIALFVILLTVPWPFREGIGRPLLPGQHEQI
jgi:heme A synthase